MRSRLTLAVFRTSAEDEDLWYGMCRDKGWGTEEDGMRAPGLSGRVHAPDAGLFQPAERRAHGAGAQGCDWRSRFVARFLQEVELKRRARSTPHLPQREFLVVNLAVRIKFIIEMIWWTGLAPWEFEFPFPGSLLCTLFCLSLRCSNAVSVYSGSPV